MQSEEFVINKGLRQDGVRSPTLYVMIMDNIIKTTKSTETKTNWEPK